MRPRFPLYARILLWFFLNLLLVVVVLSLVFRVQFRLGLDWLLAGDVADRIEAVSSLMLLELSDHPRAEWNDILDRFTHAYQLQFYVFGRGLDQLAGQPLRVPPALQSRLMAARPGPPHLGHPAEPLPPPRAEGSLAPPIPLPPDAPDAETASPDRPVQPVHHLRHPKSIVRTTDPTRYWVVIEGALRGPRHPPRPVTLVAMSNSLTGGGLLWDPKPWIAAGLSVLAVSALLWFPLVRGITTSIGQMTRATEQIASGKFDVRVNASRSDELGLLGGAINQMAVRLAGLVQGQKRFLGDIAHELCSPLARLQMALGILEQRLQPEQQTYLQTASEKAELISKLVNELLSFSKASLGPATVQLEPVSLRAVAETAVQREAADLAAVQISVPEELRVKGDQQLLIRALCNLVRNAVRYAGEFGPVTVAARTDGQHACLSVVDCGPGVPEEHLPRLFDPFYRVDASRDRSTGGVGLGLTIVKACVEACRGTVSCQNRRPTGFKVSIRLPLA